VSGRGGPTTPRGRTDLGGIAAVGINCFNLSISGTTAGGGEAEGGSGGEGEGTTDAGGGEATEEELAKGEGVDGALGEEEEEDCSFC
jgi:hypothetical protein